MAKALVIVQFILLCFSELCYVVSSQIPLPQPNLHHYHQQNHHSHPYNIALISELNRQNHQLYYFQGLTPVQALTVSPILVFLLVSHSYYVGEKQDLLYDWCSVSDLHIHPHNQEEKERVMKVDSNGIRTNAETLRKEESHPSLSTLVGSTTIVSVAFDLFEGNAFAVCMKAFEGIPKPNNARVNTALLSGRIQKLSLGIGKNFITVVRSFQSLISVFVFHHTKSSCCRRAQEGRESQLLTCDVTKWQLLLVLLRSLGFCLLLLIKGETLLYVIQRRSQLCEDRIVR